MNYSVFNLHVRILDKMYEIPCSMGITPDGNKLVIIIKEGKLGSAKELQKLLEQESIGS